MNECESKVILSSIGHNPDGSWARYFSYTQPILDEVYSTNGKPNPKSMIFTPGTSSQTIEAALEANWQVTIKNFPDDPINEARMQAIRRGLELGKQGDTKYTNPLLGKDFWINYWDGDRLLYAATHTPYELANIAASTTKYDFFIPGATLEAINTHPQPLIEWERKKSRFLGHFLGFQGDIANRGCFGFSNQFAMYLDRHTINPGDETDGFFPIMAKVFEAHLSDVRPDLSRGIGYKEYEKATAYENWMFEQLTREASRKKHDNPEEFKKRGLLVGKVRATLIKYAAMYGLPSEDPLFQATSGK